MIRYVVALALVTALFGLGFAGLDRVSTARSEVEVEQALVAVEEAAVSLLANDDLVPSEETPPRRVVDVEFPTGGVVSAPVTRLVFEPVPDAERTVVRYRVGENRENRMILDALVVDAADGTETLDLSGSSGSRTVVLELVRHEDGTPVVQATVGYDTDE